MISKIISRAACLRELASNPKSFSNCPDLHGGVADLSQDRIRMKPALGKRKGVSRWQLRWLVVKFDYALDSHTVSRRSQTRVSLVTCSLRPERNKLNSLTPPIKPGSENNSS